jgi:hypothetical protein
MQNAWDKVLSHIISAFQEANMAMRFCRRAGGGRAAPLHHRRRHRAQSQHCRPGRGIAGGNLRRAGRGRHRRIIPAGGGTKEMLRRALAYVPDSVPEGDAFPYVRRAFETIGLGKVSTSGAELIELGYLTDQDIVERRRPSTR